MAKESLFSLFQRLRRPIPPQIPPEPPKEAVKLRPDVHQIYSDRRLLVGYLVANQSDSALQEQILSDYLNSPELSHDSKLFGQFVSFCLFTFNPNPSSAIKIIQEAEPLSLDRDKQRIQTRVLRKLFNKIKPPTQESASFEEAGQQIAQQFMQNNHQLPQSVLNEYQRYVGDLTRQETGMDNKKCEQKPPVEIPAKRRHQPHPPPTNSQETASTTEETRPPFSLWLVASKNTPPVLVDSLEIFEQETAKQTNFVSCRVSREDVWAVLNKIAQMSPLDITQQYRALVDFGPYKNWTKLHFGNTRLRIIFSVVSGENRILFCVGHHDTIYETRPGRDRSRSL